MKKTFLIPPEQYARELLHTAAAGYLQTGL